MASFEDLSDDQIKALAKIQHKLLNNPEVSRQVKRLISKTDPTVRFADIEAEDQTAAALKERDKEIERLNAKQIEQDARERRAECHAKARDRGLKPEDVEKTITDYKVMDWDRAMDITERLQAMAPADAESPHDAVRLPDDKTLLDDPAGWARKQAATAINELRGRKSAH